MASAITHSEGTLNLEKSYEFVNGSRVENPPMGAWEATVANDLVQFMYAYLLKHPLGRAYCEVLFQLRKKNRLERQPDVAFVSFEQWPERVVPKGRAWPMVP